MKIKKTLLLLGLISCVLCTNAQENKIDPTGNVGIGTTNPNAHLEVNKNFDGSTSAYFLNQNSSPNSRVILLIGEQPTGGNYGYFAHHSEGHISNWGNYTTANSTWLTGADVNGLNIIAGHSQGKIVFGTSSTEKMRIANDGNVGIGTTNVDAKLRIEGNNSLARFKTEDNGFFEIQATRSNSQSLITSLKLSSQNHIILDPNPSGTSGNVGIGTTNPDMKLTVLM